MTEFLNIRSDDLSIEVSPYGAALARVWARGIETSLVLGLPSLEDYANAPHAIGVIVGPVAGRVSNARTRISGQTYVMEANTPPDCLHSGSQGLQHRLWHVERHGVSTLTLRCDLEDGACGLPGNREIRATYHVEGTALTLCIDAQSDVDTIFNATSHAYWMLDNTGDLSSHLLQIETAKYCQTNDKMIPTGDVIDGTGTKFDFTSPRCPTDGPPLDACFCLQTAPAPDVVTIMRLLSSATNLELKVASNQPGLVLYSAGSMPTLPNLAHTPKIGPFSGLAIEAQSWPDANNQPNFPDITLKSKTISKQITQFSLKLP